MTAPAAGGPDLDLDGAGVLSGWADLVQAGTAERVDPAQVGITAAAAGLDTLGAVLEPFDALLSAGFGWLLEHVWFLREPLDVLAGDPEAVLAQAGSWQRVADTLRAAADAHRSLPDPVWHGAAAAGFRRSATELTAAMQSGAEQADALSRLVLATGVAVGTTRAWIRDTIAGFAAGAARYLIAAGALAVLSAGGSVAGLVLTVVLRAQRLATRILGEVRRLLAAVAAAGDTANRLVDGLQRAVNRLREASPGLLAASAATHRGADALGLAVLIEAGKQLADAQRAREPTPGSGR